MGEFRLAHIRGKLPVKSTLTDIRARCNRIPELAAFGLHIIDRLELLQDEVAKLNENDPSRVSYADVIQHLVILTRRKPLLVRLAKGDTVALMFKELHVMLDSVKSGLHRNVAKVAKDSAYSHLSNTYRDLTKWQKKWECNQVEHISLLTKLMENVTGRQLVMELKDDKMVEKVLRKLRQTIDKGVCGAMLELVKVSFDRVASYCKLSDIQFVDWFISEDDLLFDNVPATIGTFGTVRRARWFHGGVCTRVMVKQVYPDTSNNTEDEFFCQLDRWNNLLDEHILKFYGGSHISTPRMFVCDCGPCNFRDFFIDWGNMKLFWPMFLQVAQGLKALHAQGIVHGSLKCSNIIVTDDKTVKLMDFGFDSVRTKAIVPTSVVATALAAEVRWKPKEMLEESDLSEQRFESDIYSLGMCMIEAIEKKVPFHYATDMEATDKIMRGERHRRPSTVHDSSWSLIEVLCDPDNSKRPSLDEVIERIHYLTQVHEEIETEVVHSEECNGRKVVKVMYTTKRTEYFINDISEYRKVVTTTTKETNIGFDLTEEISEDWGKERSKTIEHRTFRCHGKNMFEEISEPRLMFERAVYMPVGTSEILATSTTVQDRCPCCTELSNGNKRWCRYCGNSYTQSHDRVNKCNLLSRHVKLYNKMEAWKKICEASIDLQSLHGLGIIHKNVKPANLSIGRDGKVHLLGIKRKKYDSTSIIPDEDKLRWLAPECLSRGTLSQASDVYALGMCIIYVVTQAPPWGADISDSDVKLQVRDKHAVVPRPKGFSDNEWALVERMCAYDPASRLKINDVVKQLTKWIANDNDTPVWLLPQSMVELSNDLPFSITPLSTRYLGKWKDAKVTVEKVNKISYDTKRSFQNAANLWFSLKHPTILPLFGVCDDGKHPLFVSEYTERGDLREYIRTTDVTKDYAARNNVWQVFLDVAFAIHYLHSIGIVHSDIRLHNVLVGQDGHGKLTGFFQSSKVRPEAPEEEPTTIGEWRPSSPCICGCRTSFTSDVYWLGICLINAFCLLHDSIAQSDRGNTEEVALLYQTARCDVCAADPLPDRPEGFGDEELKLVYDMCCKEPRDRIEMSNVVERLARIVAVKVAIEKKMEPSVRLDQSASQKLQTAIFDKVLQYEEEDNNLPIYMYNDDDDSEDDEETWELLLTAKNRTITILDGLDRRVDDATRTIFNDLETFLSNYEPSKDHYKLTCEGYGTSVERCLLSQENYLGWHISSDDIVKTKRDDRTGVGSFASVYRGRWFGAPVMLKKLKKFDDGGRALREEANIWFNLRHPHIVSLFGACITNYPLFVCELVDGKKLEDCKNGSKKQLWRYLFDAAVGLQGLHLQNIVHGDLKCDNIMVTADGRAKLIDFGLSCIQSWGGEKPRGAIQWKAPEWLAGDGPTFESDIYGFGMCIVQGITGSYPWGSLPNTVVRKLVAEGNLPKTKRSYFSDSQWELVERMCHKDPTFRPTIDSVVCELREIASDS